jgi:hypothetical protein
VTKLSGKASEASARRGGDKDLNKNPGKTDMKGSPATGRDGEEAAGDTKSGAAVDPSDAIDLDVLTILRTLDVDFDDLTSKPASTKRARAPGRRPTTH